MTASLRIGRGQLLRGDCLEVLAELKLEGSFDLAYMDPPFNAGGERSARRKSGERADGRLACGYTSIIARCTTRKYSPIACSAALRFKAK